MFTYSASKETLLSQGCLVLNEATGATTEVGYFALGISSFEGTEYQLRRNHYTQRR